MVIIAAITTLTIAAITSYFGSPMTAADIIIIFLLFRILDR